MDTTITLELLEQKIIMNELTIGQALDISKIPEKYNEKRISAMIGHITGDLELAGTLTVQERYYFLLNHQALSDSDYSGANNIDEYKIETLPLEVPKTYQVGDMYISHLYGAHACVLEMICEHVADWMIGQMACQLSGDISFFIGGDERIVWDELPATLDEATLNNTIQERFELLSNLSVADFNELADAYNGASAQLTHFLELGCDNSGLTVMARGGAGNDLPARFCALEYLQGVAARLSECLAG